MLTLKKVSKIYTKEGNVTTALHDVSVHFERGEFVAVTGKSGSGKSTLLGVLSGLESIEKGEMYVEGKPTSHYTKAELERYNFDYISTIYQDYNILESFTVLENVECALMSIDDLKERRRKALEIIERVGMSERLHAKGSTLSGGEKQRTVIARAIAKDSPIILADEPTGNLDSKTAREVLELIKEISEGKLVIMVTHNYEDVKEYATRHIVVRDGEIESDELLDGAQHEQSKSETRDKYDFGDAHEYVFARHSKKDSTTTNKATTHDIFMLGAKRYASRPKQATLMTVLMSVALVIVMFVIGFMSASLVGSDYLYVNDVPGRVLVASKSGVPFDKDSAEALRVSAGASSYILQDAILDNQFKVEKDNATFATENFHIDLDKSVSVGTMPKYGEVALRIPYTYKGDFAIGEYVTLIMFDYEGARRGLTLAISGFDYYVDNITNSFGIIMDVPLFNTYVDILNKTIDIARGKGDAAMIETNITIGVNSSLGEHEILLGMRNMDPRESYALVAGEEHIPFECKGFYEGYFGATNTYIVSTELMAKMPSKHVESNQVSLIFDDKGTMQTFLASSMDGAYNAIDVQNYHVKYKDRDMSQLISRLGIALIVVILIITIGVILVLALQRLIYATRSDIAIFRTMGISSRIVKRSTYVHLLLTVLPAYLVLAILAIIMYFTPLGKAFVFIDIWGAIGLVLSSLLLVLVVAKRYNKLLYREKIGKNLRRVNK